MIQSESPKTSWNGQNQLPIPSNQQQSSKVAAALSASLQNEIKSVIEYADFWGMTLADWNHLWYFKKLSYVRKYTNSVKASDITHVELLIKKVILESTVPVEEQTKTLSQSNLMTKSRTYDAASEFLEWLDDIVANLEPWSKIAELGSWEGKALLNIKHRYRDKKFQVTWLDFATKHIWYEYDRFFSFDLEQWLPKDFPMQDLIYSNKTLQYVWNISEVLRDSYAHLLPRGIMNYHLWYKHSFTKWVLSAFAKLRDAWYIEAFGWKNDTPWMPLSIYISVQKKEDVPTIPFPQIESAYPNGGVYLWNTKNIAESSHLYREYKLPEEELFQYQIDQKFSQDRA